jgi:hypothetical protein
MVVLCVTPPPLPVIMTVRVPVWAHEPALMVIVEVPDPGAGIGLGPKEIVTLLP